MPHMPSCLDILTKLWKNLPTKNCSNYLLTLYISTFLKNFWSIIQIKNIKNSRQNVNFKFFRERGIWLVERHLIAFLYKTEIKLRWRCGAPRFTPHLFCIVNRKSGAMVYPKKRETIKNGQRLFVNNLLLTLRHSFCNIRLIFKNENS